MAEHYILEGVTDALFLDNRTTTIDKQNKNIADVTPRGVVYTLRSVREACMASVAHFTVYSILPRGCFSVCYFALAVVGQIVEQADASTHVFCM